jgi:hypothetical protein
MRGEIPMKKFIAATAFLVLRWQSAYAQMILGSIPEEYQGRWCWQENTQGVEVYKGGECKAGSLSIDRMTLDRGRLPCLCRNPGRLVCIDPHSIR